MVLWICLIAIVVSIVLGWKFKFNTGILAMGFAFVIGVFAMGLKVPQIIAFWPTNIVFFLIAISLFFTYATDNGTMELVGKKLLYAMNGNAKLIPWVIALVSAVVAFWGAGASTPAIVGPLAFAMGLSAGIHPILLAVTIGSATLIGGDNPINGFGGVISKNLIEAAGYGDSAFQMALNVWATSVLNRVLIIAIAYVFFKGYKAKKVAVEKPEPFNTIQMKTMILISIAFLLMIVPTILNTWVKGNTLISQLATFAQPQSVMIIAAILAVVLKIGDEKQVIKKLPMNPILMIAGVAMLLSVAREAGLIDAISSMLTNSVPTFMVPAMLVLFASFLSFFSSGTSVVCPLMYPLVPLLAESLSLNPVMMFSCIFIGAMASALSPFSTGGAMVIAGCPDAKVKEQLTNWMIPVSIAIPILCAILATMGMFGILTI
ncbi:SLC13 family permease [Geosporobacter ferrireducens]|uniref:Dicarboxylate carrier MatC N-terminal domain-containing protein n=1 Tax=Geosporobacter ferrireducens TaxID=1424294 RepID=A0A1D8GFZ8_9FIRM|nr:SLC13 family permease [Geosporobacter ferrireducens]AOT69820.1 hypothetical protein Gferi_09650 [Geosporobacter ferrireducens]